MKSETNGLVWSLILNVRITSKISVHSKLKVSHKCSTILYGSTCHLPLPVPLFNKNRNSSQDENLILSVPGEWNFYKIPFAFFFQFHRKFTTPCFTQSSTDYKMGESIRTMLLRLINFPWVTPILLSLIVIDE